MPLAPVTYAVVSRTPPPRTHVCPQSPPPLVLLPASGTAIRTPPRDALSVQCATDVSEDPGPRVRPGARHYAESTLPQLQEPPTFPQKAGHCRGTRAARPPAAPSANAAASVCGLGPASPGTHNGSGGGRTGRGPNAGRLECVDAVSSPYVQRSGPADLPEKRSAQRRTGFAR